jgi:phosphatidylglycerophosphate synthase
MKVKNDLGTVLLFLKNNLANIVTFIGFITSFLLLVLLWEVVSIYSLTGTASHTAKNSWAIIGLAILAGATDWADGKIARSRWGKITKFGETSDKLRDKLLIAFIFLNMIRSLYTVSATDSFIYDILVHANIALSISALVLDFFLFVMGTSALVYNYTTGTEKFATSPTRWGKDKMGVACGISLFWLIVFLFPYVLYLNFESFAFMTILTISLLALNIFACMSVYGYFARINNNS